MERESMNFDVLIVGGGPSGLSAAIKLKQLSKELSVCLIEKGSEIGSHILSGAVLEPRALNELIPNWKDIENPIDTPVKSDQFIFLTKNNAFNLPCPPQMKNHNNYIISLGNFCRWLASQAEGLGVEIYPGFPASEIIYDENSNVKGVITGDLGIDKNNSKTESYTPGMKLLAKQTIFAEGCRGHLTKSLFEKFNLKEGKDPQTFALGIKELWEIDPMKSDPGSVKHTIGWPLDINTYGGSFIYHLKNNQVAVGYVIGLDYKNPYLSPYEEFQRFKTHPKIKQLFENGRRVAYGARALNEGGFQSIPKLSFPGGCLVGCTAGFLNVPKIKGTHTAMKSGMLAAESVFELVENQFSIKEPLNYGKKIEKSWIWDELYKVRNIRPAFTKGLWLGLSYAAIDTYVFQGKAPWTFHHKNDHEQLELASKSKKIDYPKPDNKISFDRNSSVFLSGTNHEENQPCHLKLNNDKIPIEHNFNLYDSPEQRYCPAGVYEIIMDKNNNPNLQINAQNCVHCKTCDIKDPKQNIEWVCPEGGGGPNYPNM